MSREIVIDNFAGGGGASTGIEAALGRPIDVAINHDAEAVAMHKLNHPGTEHLCQSVWKADPRDVAGGRPVGLAWFSPDCKHFSKAKGSKPVEKNIRDLAWVVVHWAKLVRPRIIMLENVEEFRDWGPLIEAEDCKLIPCPLRKGLTFRRWKRELVKLGYKVEDRELRACDYGAPTSRKRLFVVARCDGLPIVWPEPTHGKGRPLPWRTAAEIINWMIPCPSIFTRKRPLAENTMRRIAQGVKRYVLDAAEPFIVSVAHGDSGGRREYPIGDPLGTVTGGGIAHALVTPFLAGVGGRMGQSPARPVDAPYHTTTAKADTVLVSPVLVGAGGPAYGGKPKSAADPLNTMTTENHTALVAAFLAQHNGGMVGHAATEPVSTITMRGTQQQVVAAHLLNLKGSDRRDGPVDRPAPTICAGGTHIAEVRAFLIKYFGTATGQPVTDPLHTVTALPRFGLVTVHGVDYVIVDIGMRMLAARELFNAQGFPPDYIIEFEHAGRPLPKSSQVRLCGNSVCPPLSEVLVRANFAAVPAQMAGEPA